MFHAIGKRRSVVRDVAAASGTLRDRLITRGQYDALDIAALRTLGCPLCENVDVNKLLTQDVVGFSNSSQGG